MNRSEPSEFPGGENAATTQRTGTTWVDAEVAMVLFRVDKARLAECIRSNLTSFLGGPREQLLLDYNGLVRSLTIKIAGEEALRRLRLLGSVDVLAMAIPDGSAIKSLRQIAKRITKIRPDLTYQRLLIMAKEGSIRVTVVKRRMRSLYKARLGEVLQDLAKVNGAQSDLQIFEAVQGHILSANRFLPR